MGGVFSSLSQAVRGQLNLFGFTVEAQPALKYSKVAASGLFGLSMATVVSGGIAVLVIICAGLYIYRRKKRNTKIVEQAVSQVLLNQQQIQAPAIHIPQSSNWQPISMTQAQFDDIVAFIREQDFIEQLRDLTCSINIDQVMKLPCTMKCCKKENQKRCADKYMLQHQIKANKRCAMCGRPATIDFIQLHQTKYTHILGVRHRILKTYKNLPDAARPAWKIMIEKYFGKNYIEKYLGEVK